MLQGEGTIRKNRILLFPTSGQFDTTLFTIIYTTISISFDKGNATRGGGLNFDEKSFMKWKGIKRKQSTRWQHLSRLKASAFFALQNFFSCYETQQLTLGTGTAIWWVTEPQ